MTHSNSAPPPPLPADSQFDITIIGAGPVGLFAAFYAGLRTMKVKVIDVLTEAGGQLAALYPDKYIYDVAGFPKVKSRDLVEQLVEQAMQYSPTVCLGEQATTLAAADGGYVIGSSTGAQHRTKTVLLTAGIGSFAPRKLTDATLARFEGKGLHYVLPGLDSFRGRRVLLLGGGDTAVDWALHLEPLASELTLIHRRDQFRAHEDSVRKLHASRCKVVSFHELRTLEGESRIERAIIYDNRSNADTTLVVDDVVVNFGFVANLGPLKSWGLTIKGNSLEVSQKMETNLPGIFGAGDLVTYPGKLKLIATGFGEAAMAVCAAKMVVDPAARYFPGHSSEMKEEAPASA